MLQSAPNCTILYQLWYSLACIVYESIIINSHWEFYIKVLLLSLLFFTYAQLSPLHLKCLKYKYSIEGADTVIVNMTSFLLGNSFSENQCCSDANNRTLTIRPAVIVENSVLNNVKVIGWSLCNQNFLEIECILKYFGSSLITYLYLNLKAKCKIKYIFLLSNFLILTTSFILNNFMTFWLCT